MSETIRITCMISPTPDIFTARPASAPRQVRATDLNFAIEHLQRFAAPIPTEEPFDWCVNHVVFADTEVSGPFNPTGREYLRDPINDADDSENREKTLICATGTGKTIAIMCRHLWTIVHHPRRALMVMPATKGEGGSETYVTSRFIPALKATKPTAALMPDGQERLFMNSKKVRLNGCHFGFVGGNSPTQVASNRCSLIDIDEIDKMKGRLGNEAGTKALVGERTEGVADYQIFQSTTPTIEDGQGWKCLLRSDFRRRFLPCPRCNSEARHKGLLMSDSISAANLKGWFDLAWSEQYCVLPTKFHTGEIIPRAFIHWDAACRRRDDTWDKDRLVRSTRLECPHCGGHIMDEDKIWLDKNGVWLPLRASHGHKGYHLSALYAPPLVTRESDPTHKSLLGGRALKFIDALEEGEGMKNFINSTLAEVDVSQDKEVLTINSGENYATEEWPATMACDYQKLWPYIWFVVQKWSTFKLHPPFPLSNGKPQFAGHLEKNPALKKQCETIIAGHEPAWLPLAEILRFDPRTGQFPLLDFLISQSITGPKLVELWRERCGLNTLDLGRFCYSEMGLRLPKGGDSEIIAAGHCEHSGDDLWDELRELQQQYGVGRSLKKFGLHPNRAVLIDSGYAEKHNPEVLRACHESGVRVWLKCPHCNPPGHPNAQKYGPCCVEWYDPMTKKFVPHRLHQFMRPVFKHCWTPYRGRPSDRPNKDASGLDAYKKWIPGDPFLGLREADKNTIRVLESASEHYFRKWIEKRARQKQIREAIAAGKTYRGNVWNVATDCKFHGRECQKREDLERQLNSKGIDAEGKIWERGSGGGGKRRHPDHLLDCASQMQESLAETLGFFSYEAKTEGTK